METSVSSLLVGVGLGPRVSFLSFGCHLEKKLTFDVCWCRLKSEWSLAAEYSDKLCTESKWSKVG